MATNHILYKVHCCCQKLAPFGSADVNATAGVGAWVVGSLSATSFIITTTNIIIDMVYISPSNDHFDIEIVDSTGTDVYATVHASGIAAPDTMQHIYTGGSPVVPSGTTLKARIQSATGSNSCDMKIGYKEV